MIIIGADSHPAYQEIASVKYRHRRVPRKAFSISQGSEGVLSFLGVGVYCSRSDFIGSIRTARRAGTKHAAIATSIRAKATLV
jgi:hypothetical protein